MKRSATRDELKAALVIILSNIRIILRPFPFVQTDVKDVKFNFTLGKVYCSVKKKVFASSKHAKCNTEIILYMVHINIQVTEITCTSKTYI